MKTNKIIISIIVCLLAIGQITAQSMTKKEIDDTMNHAFALDKLGKYEEALEKLLSVGRNTKSQRTKDERQAYICSLSRASFYYLKFNRYNEGYSLAKELLSVKLTEEEKTDVYMKYVANGFYLAQDLMQRNKKDHVNYSKARKILIEIAPFADKTFITYILPRIPTCWYFEGCLHLISQNLKDAQKCFENALQDFNKLKLTKNIILTLRQLAYIHEESGNIEKSIKTYEHALSLSQQIGNSSLAMNIAPQLYKLNNSIGNLEHSVKYVNMMDSIVETTDNLQTQFDYYIEKGKNAQNQRRFNLAEQFFLKGRMIAETEDSIYKNANRLSIVYVNLSNLYTTMHRYKEALHIAKLEQKEIKRMFPTEVDRYYWSYATLANIYCNQKDQKNCFACLDSLFKIEPQLHEPLEQSLLYTTRGTCYRKFEDYNNALKDYKKADEILSLSKSSLFNAQRKKLYPSLAGMELRLNNFNKSVTYLKQYLNYIKSAYGQQSIKYVEALTYLANAQGFANDIKNGCTIYSSAAKQLKDIIKYRLPYMNTSEREGFWSPLSSLLTDMTPFALKAKLYQTEFTKDCYNALLMSKAFLLDTERSISEIVQQEGNEEHKQMYMQIVSINNKIKKWEKNYTQYADSILKAVNSVSLLENELTQKCRSIGNITDFMEIDYSSVASTLKKNEYLVDFTDFISKTEGRKYAAYIIEKKKKYPLLKLLFKERQIDSLGIVRSDMFYDVDYSSKVIKYLWEPIKAYFPKGATIYYVPSQLLFQVCLESLPLKDGTLLGDHYNFVRLSSAKELVKGYSKKIKRSSQSSAVLYGGLLYDLEPYQMIQNAQKYDLSSLMIMRGDVFRGDSTFHELPGSEIEIKKIYDILKGAKMNVVSYSGTDGTEESFLNMHKKSPQILHLATHGFYYTPSDASEVDYLKGYTDAMYLSGLVMAGGNAAWTGQILPKGVLSGILTANNIAQLDLSKTDMVVLSACQSGQGNVTAEGLYGLQRAFKKAGVNTMVMTLWNVSDKVTTDFMIKFYECLVDMNWNKRKAFNRAKAMIRKQYPDPFYWAAFMILD